MSRCLSLVLLGLPALPLAAGIAARVFGPRPAGRLTAGAAAAAAILAAVAVALLAVEGPQTVRWAPLGKDAAFAVALRLDAVSAMMGLLVAFLGTVVLGFSRNSWRAIRASPGSSRG